MIFNVKKLLRVKVFRRFFGSSCKMLRTDTTPSQDGSTSPDPVTPQKLQTDTQMHALTPKDFAILRTVDSRLAAVITEVAKYYGLQVLSGFRERAEQEELFRKGRTKVHWPYSAHNINSNGSSTPPCKAVDVAPYPIDWDDSKRFIYMAGLILATARGIGLNLRWGGNWDMDQIIIDDQDFDDLVHFEIV